MSLLFDFRGRMVQVGIASKLARHNHILNATARAVWSHIYKNGFAVTGPIDAETVQNVYVRLVRDAIRSVICYGYFAIVIDPLPRVFDPETYMVVERDKMGEAVVKGDVEPFHVVFFDQGDCDRFRNKTRPLLFVVNAPNEAGQLTCPAMQLVDMHDAIIEFTRLALLNDGINVRPKAWTSEKETTKQPGVYRFLEDDDLQMVSGGAMGDKAMKTKLDQANQRGMVRHMLDTNMHRMHALETQLAEDVATDRRMGRLRGPFSTACLSRNLDIDNGRDPSVLVEVKPNIDITQMPNVHTRADLVDLLRLFDQRMCNALGVPPTLIGLPAPNNVSNHDDEAVKLWENVINPIRDVLNLALAETVARAVTPKNAIMYKKTGEKKWLGPVRIEIIHSLSLVNILQLEPYLTDVAFCRHLSLCTGLDVSELRPRQEEGVFATRSKQTGTKSAPSE